jgi:hypothetical protein
MDGARGPFILTVPWVEVAAGNPVEDFCRPVSRRHLEVEVAPPAEHSGRLLAAALVV